MLCNGFLSHLTGGVFVRPVARAGMILLLMSSML